MGRRRQYDERVWCGLSSEARARAEAWSAERRVELTVGLGMLVELALSGGAAASRPEPASPADPVVDELAAVADRLSRVALQLEQAAGLAPRSDPIRGGRRRGERRVGRKRPDAGTGRRLADKPAED